MKLNFSKHRLEVIDAPLVTRLQEFESKREGILNYAFTTLTAVQQKVFASFASGLEGYQVSEFPSVPHIPILSNYGSGREEWDLITR